MMIQPTQKQLDILMKLTEVEQSMGRLYEVYAELFPDYKEFWLSLVTEEKQHAQWINDLHSYIVQGIASFDSARFNTVAIQTFINSMDDELGKAKNHEISLTNALSMSLRFEESLLEHKFFQIVSGDSPKFKQLLSNLAEATQKHIEKVRKTLNTYRHI